MILDRSPLKLSIHDIDTLCQHYLAVLYHGVHMKNATNHVWETYGEILYPSIDRLLSEIVLTKEDVFVDYGSGLGKIVLQVFIKSIVKAAYGIEISSELHQYATKAATQLHHDLPDFFENERKLVFLQGSFLEVSILAPTVALVNSACFTQNLLAALGKVIEATPSIHTVLSLRPIHTLQRLTFSKSIRIECSWDTALCYVYRLPND